MRHNQARLQEHTRTRGHPPTPAGCKHTFVRRKGFRHPSPPCYSRDESLRLRQCGSAVASRPSLNAAAQHREARRQQQHPQQESAIRGSSSFGQWCMLSSDLREGSSSLEAKDRKSQEQTEATASACQERSMSLAPTPNIARASPSRPSPGLATACSGEDHSDTSTPGCPKTKAPCLNRIVRCSSDLLASLTFPPLAFTNLVHQELPPLKRAGPHSQWQPNPTGPVIRLGRYRHPRIS